MKVVRDIDEARTIISGWKKKGDRIGLVPTMGFFHEGHLSLMHESIGMTDKTIVSLFVNPKQFGENEDLSNYPKDLENDIRLAEKTGVNLLFCPSNDQIYPQHYQTNISVKKLSQGLCSKSRPTHFDGVATVVTKLFNILTPDVAIFGKKDYQQLSLIKQMVIDLNFNIQIIGHEIYREANGLAMSSRNKYLSAKEKGDGAILHRALLRGVELVLERNEINSSDIQAELTDLIHGVENFRVDYIEIVDAITLEEKKVASPGDIIALAAYVREKVRLIDNMEIVHNT